MPRRAQVAVWGVVAALSSLSAPSSAQAPSLRLQRWPRRQRPPGRSRWDRRPTARATGRSGRALVALRVPPTCPCSRGRGLCIRYPDFTGRSASSARTLQTGWWAGVLQRARIRDRGRARAQTRVHPQHRRSAFLARRVHGRAPAPHRRRPAAHVPRPLRWTMGRRDARHRLRRVQRKAVARRSVSNHRAASSHRAYCTP